MTRSDWWPAMAVSLFSGIGGFEEALRRAGIPTVLSCELDKPAQGVLADHFDHALHDDVRTLTADECRAAGFVPDRGILCGGFPCQDLSVAGRRAGLAGARSGLFFEIVRLADALHPRWLILENVPGLLSANDGRDMGAVVGALVELGYGVAWRVLDAQHFGVPQRRRRVVIVGCLGDRAAPVEILFEPESLQGNPPPRGAAREIAPALTANGLGGGGADDNLAQARHVVPALVSRYGKGTDSDATDGLIGFDLAQITSNVNRSNPQPGDPMPPLAHGGQPHLAYALSARQHGVGQGHNTTYVTHALTAEGADASEDGTGRGTPFIPVGFHFGSHPGAELNMATTLTGRNGDPGAAMTGMAVRRLSPLECERLQGFPDGWTATSWGKPQADAPRYRQLGNAIAVPVFEWVARRLVSAA